MPRRSSCWVFLAALPLLAPAGARAERPPARDASTTDAYMMRVRVDDGAKRLSVVGNAGLRRQEGGARAATDGGAWAPIGPATATDVSPTTATTAAAGSGYACVRNQKRRHMTIYKPKALSQKTDAYYLQYKFHMYRMGKARRIGPSAVEQKQYEICAVGGGKPLNGHRLRRLVATTIAHTGQQLLIGQKWDEGSEESNAKASLGFDVPAGPVTISASVDIEPKGHFGGSLGPDDMIPDAEEGENRFVNQVNNIWEYGGALTRFQGAKGFEGNVSHALYEMPMGTKAPDFDLGAFANTSCARLLGC
jgi:hypothetical protein